MYAEDKERKSAVVNETYRHEIKKYQLNMLSGKFILVFFPVSGNIRHLLPGLVRNINHVQFPLWDKCLIFHDHEHKCLLLQTANKM